MKRFMDKMKHSRQNMKSEKPVNSILKIVFTGAAMLSVFVIVVLLGMYGYNDTKNSNHMTRQELSRTNEQVEDVTKVVENMQSSADDMETSIMTLGSTLDTMQGNLEAIKEVVPEDADIAGKMDQVEKIGETITLVKQELEEVNRVIDSLEHFAGDTQQNLIGVDAYTTAVNESLISINDQISDITSDMLVVQEDIIARKERDSELSAAIDSAEADFDQICDAITTDINGINLDMGRVTSNIQELQSSLRNTDTSISEMQSRFDEQTADMKGNMTNLEGNMSDMKGSMTDLEGNMSDMKGSMTDMEGNVAEMGEKVLRLQGEVTSANTKLTTLSENVESYRTSLSESISAISSQMTGDVAGLREEMNKLSAIDSGIRESINTLEANDTGIRETMTTLSADASVLQDTVAALSVKVNECFQSVSDGKALLASAITDKGVVTTADAAYDVMADNIKAIETTSKIPRNGSAYHRSDWGANSFAIGLNLPGKGTYDITVDASLLWNTGAGMGWERYHTLTIDGVSTTSTRITVDGPTTIKVIGESDYKGLVTVYVKYAEVL